MWYYYYIFILGLIYVQTNFINSQDFGQCRTPNNEKGHCVFINQCPELEKLFQKDPWTKAEELFLIQSQCTDVDEDEVVLCCRYEDPQAYTATARPFLVSPTLSPQPVTLLPTSECGIEDGFHYLMNYGNITEIWEYPWMALLLYTRRGEPPLNGCGGALINTRYVLTAANCLSPRKRRRKRFQLTTVRLGEWDINSVIDTDQEGETGDAAVDVGIERQIIHELYDRTIRSAYNDIALLRLDREVEYTRFIKPICIHRTDDLLNKDMSQIQMFAAGWGYTENNTASNLKLAVSLFGKSLDTCQSKYSAARVRLGDTQLCAGGDNWENNTDTCVGDLGGPLVTLERTTVPPHYHLVGVLSFGPVPCGEKNFPGVYTKVIKFLPWIESNLSP